MQAGSPFFEPRLPLSRDGGIAIMNDEEAAIIDDFTKGSRKPKVNLIEMELDDEHEIFFRDRDAKNGDEFFCTATIVPKGSAGTDEWWISSDRCDELIAELEAIGVDPRAYTWKVKNERNIIWFNCKNRVKWKASDVIKDYITLRLAKLALPRKP